MCSQKGPDVIWYPMIRSKQYRLKHLTDHHALLDACRLLMQSKENFTLDHSRHPAESDGHRFLDPRDPKLPEPIREAAPVYIHVTEDSVSLKMHGGHYHWGLNAYREGIEGSGDLKLLTGLWYWTD